MSRDAKARLELTSLCYKPAFFSGNVRLNDRSIAERWVKHKRFLRVDLCRHVLKFGRRFSMNKLTLHKLRNYVLVHGASRSHAPLWNTSDITTDKRHGSKRSICMLMLLSCCHVLMSRYSHCKHNVIMCLRRYVVSVNYA